MITKVTLISTTKEEAGTIGKADKHGSATLKG
jgi:hypothetical protein